MARIDNLLSNAKYPEEYLVVRVDKNNILNVLLTEQTATVTKPENFKEKNIVIICEDLVVAVATIKEIGLNTV